MTQNKMYDFCGIGNALVDIDFETTQEILQKLQIEKGVMTLINAKRHAQLLEHLKEVKHVKACGGSAANTTIAITLLGGKTFYSCKVACDTAGDFFYEELVNHNVGTNLTKDNREKGTTGSCLVLVTPDADRTMNTYLGITENFSTRELNEQAIANSEYLYIEGYLSSSPSGSKAAITAYEMAKKHNIKISLTLSDPNMVKFFNDNLKKMLGTGVDLLFCNEDEARFFCGSDDLDNVCECMKNFAKTFAITRGPKGSLVYDGTSLHRVGAKDVKVLDTVGAGDMYAGGFIYAITHGYDYKTAGVIGDIVASKVITKFGPRLTVDEINDDRSNIRLVFQQFLPLFYDHQSFLLSKFAYVIYSLVVPV